MSDVSPEAERNGMERATPRGRIEGELKQKLLELRG